MMTRRMLIGFAGVAFGGVVRAASARRGAWRARRGSAQGGNTVEFVITAEEPFPVRGLDPELRIGDVVTGDYRWGGSDNRTLVFVCFEGDKLVENAPMYVQYGTDTNSRVNLPNFRRSALQ